MLATGTVLGRYTIESPLGAGGMGEVYRARDGRLSRDVAVKVLSADLASDPERQERFEREARAVAALEHPHICGIYDVGEFDGMRYLVMPLLEGETLAARLEQRPLSIMEAVRIAREIADALDKAHRQGIVHRDLKPANVMLTKTGVKLLDFGLAKLRGNSSPVTLSTHTQTETTAIGTAQGAILGTLHYMAPEQVEGKEADHRADIWALGVVLYEMVTGARPFQGGTPASVVGAILRETPAIVTSRQPLAPPALAFVVERCLSKDADQRWYSAGDVGRQLEWFARTPPPAEGAQVRAARRPWPWAIAAVALLIAGAALTMRPSITDAAGRKVVRLDLSLPPGAEPSTIAAPSASISPDGRRVVFTAMESGFRRLYVRDLDRATAQVLVTTDASSQCYFSADGNSVAFVSSDRILRRLSLTDGLSTVLARGVDRNFGASWGTDGFLTYVSGGALQQIPGGGGEVRSISVLDRTAGELFHAWPAGVPGTSAVLYTVVTGRTRDSHRIDVVNPSTGQRHTVVEIGSYPMLASTGPLVFLRDGVLVAAPLDRERFVVTGPPVKVADDIAFDLLGAPLASLSAGGALVYVSAEAAASQLMVVDRSGLMAPLVDERKAYDYPRLSPDGVRTLVSVSGDLWLIDSRRSTSTRVTAQAAVGNSYGVWLPDGKRVIFRTATGLRLGYADGGGVSEPIPDSSVADFPHAISADGNTLLFTRQTAESSGDVFTLSLSGPTNARALFSSAAYEGGAVLSPDGRWLAYASNETSRYEVYVRPFPDSSRKFTASVDGGTQPMWSRDGKQLFYRNGTKMFAVPVLTGNDFSMGKPSPLFDEDLSFGTGITFAHYDVTPDGRFVMIKRSSASRYLNVVLNWTTELDRLMKATP